MILQLINLFFGATVKQRFKRLDNIDRRCDRRIDNEQSKEYPKIKNRRKKLFTK
jgi:hypothetical protein